MLDFQRLMFRSHVQKARQSQCKVNLIFGASPAQNSWNSSPGRAWSKRCPKSLSENTSSRSTMSRWWVLRYWWNIVTCPGTQRSSVQQLHDASTHAQERTGRCLLLPVWFYKIDGCHPLVSLMGVNLQNDVPWCSQGIKQWECWDTSAIAQLVAAKVTILTACEVTVGSELGTAWFLRVQFGLNIKIIKDIQQDSNEIYIFGWGKMM